MSGVLKFSASVIVALILTFWDKLVVGTKVEKKGERPKSAGNVPDESFDQKGNSSEPVDWLGLSRLGSPAEKRDDTKPAAENSSSGNTKKETEKSSGDPDDDWLGLASNSKSNRSRSPPKAVTDEDDDWLSLGATGTRKSRRGSQSRSRSPDKSTSDKSDDWLGPGKETEDMADDWLSATLKSKKENRLSSAGDDWLGFNEAKSSKADSADYLGLGEDIAPDALIK